jgi:transposase
MSRKRTYGTVDVERIDVVAIIQLLTVGCIVAIDVAKTKFVAAIATATGEVLRLIRFEHPRQTKAFLGVIQSLHDSKREPRVVMEPTGTYGDALRHQCHERGVPVQMVSPKHTRDFAEVLDGVPSTHDAKAAVVIAKLAALKKARCWKPSDEATRDLRALLDRRSPASRTASLYYGHLEAMLARHWPEFSLQVDLHGQRSWMKLLQLFPCPRAIASAKDEVSALLHQASRGRLGAERIEAIVESARTTWGVPMTGGEKDKLASIARRIEEATHELDAIDKKLADAIAQNPMAIRIAKVVGPACAAAIISHVGNVAEFLNASAVEKAMGLNLKERSSGNDKGEFTIGITKRGSSHVRQLLFLAALRFVKENAVALAWYRGRSAHRSGQKKKAIVAVMRKLARALFHVARGADFDATKLFDVRRLDLPENNDSATTGASEPLTASPLSRPKPRRKEGGVVQATT